MIADIWIGVLIAAVWLLAHVVIAESISDQWARRFELFTVAICWIAIIWGALQ